MASNTVHEFFQALKREKIIENSYQISNRSIIIDGQQHDLDPYITYCINESGGYVIKLINGDSCYYKLERNSNDQFEIYFSHTGIDTNSFLIRGASCLVQTENITWLIKNIIPKGKSLTGIIGKSGSGKTYVVLDWALSIATGIPQWNGHKIRSGKVLYLCAEGLSGINNRITVWCQEHGGIDYNKPLLNKNFMRSTEGIKIDDEFGLDKLIKDLNEAKFSPDIIIIDTLNRFMSGDENSQRDATSFIDSCDKLGREYDCSIVYVHHIGYSPSAQNRARGSSVFYASLDYEYLVSLDSDRATVNQTKVKDGEKQEPQYLRFESHEISKWYDEDGEPIKSSILVPTTPPVVQKSARQLEDEKICFDAFCQYGEMDENDEILISKENFTDFYIKNVKDKNGSVPDRKTVSREFNPKQERRFINRLTNCGYIDPMENENGEIAGWFLLDSKAYSDCRTSLHTK